MKIDKQKPVRRWALWSPIFGFLLPLPGQTERLYTSRSGAVADRLSGHWYDYKPVRVELRPLSVLKFK